MFNSTLLVPFRCEVCGKSFKKLGQLNQHIKTHDENRKKDTRTRICYTCGKEVLAIYYSKHMRSELRELPLLCGTFGKMSKTHLFFRYKHGGANVKCTMCDTTFAHEVKLKAHMKNVHTYVVSQNFESPTNFYVSHDISPSLDL